MDEVLRALKYRAWHRGTREADLMIGGFFDAHHASWDAHERALFAALLAEQDVIGPEHLPPNVRAPLIPSGAAAPVSAAELPAEVSPLRSLEEVDRVTFAAE